MKKLLFISIFVSATSALAQFANPEILTYQSGGLLMRTYTNSIQISGAHGDNMVFTPSITEEVQVPNRYVYENSRCRIVVKKIFNTTELRKNSEHLSYLGVTIEVLSGENECRLESKEDSDKVEVTGFYSAL